MTRTWVRTTSLLLLAGGCAAPPLPVAPPPVEIAPSPSASAVGAPLLDPTIVSISAVRAPTGLQIDGDLGEWGSLPPPLPSLPAPVGDDEPEEKAGAPAKPPKKKEVPPNPPEASSRLAFALTHEAVLIAASLGEQARDGIWLGVGAQAADMPVLGQYFGRMGFVPLDCEQSPMVTGDEGDQGYYFEPNPPETVAACQAVRARQAEAKARHEKRFARLFKIDREGVRDVSADGGLFAVAGAKSVLKSGPKGATAEISLPLAAMPRLAEAPVETLWLWARAATQPKPPLLAPGQWVWVKLPDAVSFEPYGALRVHAFKRALDLGTSNDVGSTRYKQPRGLSYQPGDALRVEVIDSPDCSVSAPREEPLYQKQASLGDVEVGYVAAPKTGSVCKVEFEPWLAIFAKGKVVDIIELQGSPRGIATRGGELHVLSYQDTSWAPVAGSWSVVAIAPNGTHRAVVVEPVVGTKEPEGPPYWEGASDFASKELDSFVWRGTRGGRGVEARWNWDEARKMYTGKQRSIPPTTKAKKARR